MIFPYTKQKQGVMQAESGALRVVEVGGPDALARLEPEWRALQARSADCTPYQTWEWNQAWWRHFGARKRARLLLFYARKDVENSPIRGAGGAPNGGEGSLVGLAPLYVSRHLGTPLRRLAWMGTGPSDYLGVLALPEFEAEVAANLLRHLENDARGWDIADLQQIRPHASLLTGVEPSDSPVNFGEAATRAVAPMEPCPYLALPATWEEFTQRIGKKLRSNLGYYDRQLQKNFQEARYTLADAETLDAGMTALFALHQQRWNARWLPGVLGNRRVQAFHREVAARFLANGWLRLHLLTIDGEIRSVLHCFAFGGRTYYYLGGFAPDLGKYSLGTLLTGRAIRQAIAEGCSEFDFLRGNEAYKYRWSPEERVNHRLLLLRTRAGSGGLPMLPGRAGFALNRMERYVEHRAKAFAAQQGRRERAPKSPAPDTTLAREIIDTRRPKPPLAWMRRQARRLKAVPRRQDTTSE